MNQPCPVSSPCQNPANPVTNYTAEAPDAEIFLGFGSSSDPPAAGQSFDNGFGYFYCQSLTSQEAAALCAYNGGVGNGDNGGGTSNGDLPNTALDPGNHGGTTLYWNTPQQGSATCPDGTVFTYTMPANSVRSNNPVLVDRIAASIAQIRANRFLICISNISGACLGEEYDQIITASSQSDTIDWQLRSGMLPPGLVFQFDLFNSKQIAIFGTPTVAGNYVFTLRATDASGNFMDKTFTLAVLGITNSPTQATVGTPYSFQFTAAGGTAPYTFSVPPGHLPAGLSMSASGLITGTPTDTIPTTFTVTIDDSAGNQCGTQFTMTPTASTCVGDVGAIIWSPQTGPGNVTMVAGSGNFNLIANNFTATNILGSITNTSNQDYQIQVAFVWTGNIGIGGFAQVTAYLDGGQFAYFAYGFPPTANWSNQVVLGTVTVPANSTHQISLLLWLINPGSSHGTIAITCP